MEWKCNPSDIENCLTCPLPRCRFDDNKKDGNPPKWSDKEYRREYFIKNRDAAEKANLCVRCWKAPADEGYKSCAACRAYKRAAYYQKKPTAAATDVSRK